MAAARWIDDHRLNTINPYEDPMTFKNNTFNSDYATKTKVREQETNWIEEALTHADDEPIFADLDGMRDQRSALATQRKNALPIEADLIERLDTEIEKLDEIIAREAEFQAQQHGPSELNGYKRIHLEVPLSWRNDGAGWKRDDYGSRHFTPLLPRLAVFPINSSKLRFRAGDPVTRTEAFSFWQIAAAVLLVIGTLITGSVGVFGPTWVPFMIVVSLFLAINIILLVSDKIGWARRNGVFPKLPQTLAKHYDDIIEANRTPDDGYSRPQFDRTCHFVGTIPEDTKAKIKKAEKTFGVKNIFIVAEATNWDNEDKVIRNPDPIVIGVKGETTYMIDAFDLVPVEQAVVSEFTD